MKTNYSQLQSICTIARIGWMPEGGDDERENARWKICFESNLQDVVRMISCYGVRRTGVEYELSTRIKFTTKYWAMNHFQGWVNLLLLHFAQLLLFIFLVDLDVRQLSTNWNWLNFYAIHSVRWYSMKFTPDQIHLSILNFYHLD